MLATAGQFTAFSDSWSHSHPKMACKHGQYASSHAQGLHILCSQRCGGLTWKLEVVSAAYAAYAMPYAAMPLALTLTVTSAEQWLPAGQEARGMLACTPVRLAVSNARCASGETTASNLTAHQAKTRPNGCRKHAIADHSSTVVL